MPGNAILNRFSVRRSLLGLVVGVFGIASAVSCASLADLDPVAAEAIIQNVDSLSGEVTVQFKDGTTTTFNLEDVDIEALSQLIGDASLQAGDEIEVELDSSSNVKAVTPHTANLKAMIVEVDTDADTMTVEAFNGVQLELTFTVDTRIQLDDDVRGTVADLAPGILVKVKYDTETNEALKIKHEDDDDNEEKGAITAINADDHTITVEGVNGVVETYIVLPHTEIEVDGRAAFSELQVGMLVELEFDAATLELDEVEVKLDDDDHSRGDDDDEHELKGTITGVDVDAGTITVESLNGITETYTVHSDTEIEIGDDASLSDLEVGMQVEIEFDGETLALSEVEVRMEDDEDEDDGEDDEDDDDDD